MLPSYKLYVYIAKYSRLWVIFINSLGHSAIMWCNFVYVQALVKHIVYYLHYFSFPFFLTFQEEFDQARMLYYFFIGTKQILLDYFLSAAVFGSLNSIFASYYIIESLWMRLSLRRRVLYKKTVVRIFYIFISVFFLFCLILKNQFIHFASFSIVASILGLYFCQLVFFSLLLFSF